MNGLDVEVLGRNSLLETFHTLIVNLCLNLATAPNKNIMESTTKSELDHTGPPALGLVNSSKPVPMMKLPVELHMAIIDNLTFPDNITLQMTSRYFWKTIKPLSHIELLQAETSYHSRVRDLFACQKCLRLRYGTEYADKMTKGKRSAGGHGAGIRFCIDCGINPKYGQPCYCRGSHIVVEGQICVRCIECDRVRVSLNGTITNQCRVCWDRAAYIYWG